MQATRLLHLQKLLAVILMRLGQAWHNSRRVALWHVAAAGCQARELTDVEDQSDRKAQGRRTSTARKLLAVSRECKGSDKISSQGRFARNPIVSIVVLKRVAQHEHEFSLQRSCKPRKTMTNPTPKTWQ